MVPRTVRGMAVTALSHGVRALGLWAVLAVPVVLARLLGLVEHVPWGATAAGLVALALAAACARHLPATALLLAAAPGLAFGTALFTADYGFALPVLAYLLGLRGGARQTTAACAALALSGSARVLWRAEDPVTAWLLLLAVLLFLVVFPWLAGRYRLQRRALAEAGWARAARLEEERAGGRRACGTARAGQDRGRDARRAGPRAEPPRAARRNAPGRGRPAGAAPRGSGGTARRDGGRGGPAARDRRRAARGRSGTRPGGERLRPPSPHRPPTCTTFSAARWPRGSRYGSWPGPSGPTRTRRCATGWCGKHSPTPRATRRAPK
ncbi:hypothetical protein GA0115246_106402 [Streptomyces sp. SolWspMP-sol7th]|nr:hypothetical protein GA0115246_106402 [Streptomyces sp. SolWspMP-sol7th]